MNTTARQQKKLAIISLFYYRLLLVHMLLFQRNDFNKHLENKSSKIRIAQASKPEHLCWERLFASAQRIHPIMSRNPPEYQELSKKNGDINHWAMGGHNIWECCDQTDSVLTEGPRLKHTQCAKVNVTHATVLCANVQLVTRGVRKTTILSVYLNHFLFLCEFQHSRFRIFASHISGC